MDLFHLIRIRIHTRNVKKIIALIELKIINTIDNIILVSIKELIFVFK